MEIGEIAFYVCIGLILLYQIYKVFFKKTEEEKEYLRKLKESLADEYIYDPKTGAKFTLEQAESGHWISHNNEHRIISESEIEKLYTDEQKNVERALNYLKQSQQYQKQRPTPNEINYLEHTSILSKYNDWSYSDSFALKNCNGYLFIPTVSYDNFREPQIMFWLKLRTDFGHYYLREKSHIEKFFDLIRNDDDLRLPNYESFTIKKTVNLSQVVELLKRFEGSKGLEIEFKDNNLFIKNNKLVNISEIEKIENIVKNLC
ncbi:hypothetical protein [Aquimarina sp. 433]